MPVTADELTSKHCTACEGGVTPFTPAEITDHLAAVPGWAVLDDGKHIRRKWKFKDFLTALRFMNRVGELAENEGHHPDLHLTGYRQVAVELTTFACGGLTLNDFVLAAWIDRLPV